MNPRPTSVTVFGILNIVFGALGLCGMLANMVLFLVPRNPAVKNPVLEMMNANSGYALFLRVNLVLGSIVSVIIIAAGIGLLKLKPWGRFLSIGYGVYAIISGLVGIVVNYFFIVRPLLVQVAGQAGQKAAAAKVGATIGVVGGTIGGCLGFIYPVLLLIFMNRPNVKAAFSGEPMLPTGDPFATPDLLRESDPDNPYQPPHMR